MGQFFRSGTGRSCHTPSLLSIHYSSAIIYSFQIPTPASSSCVRLALDTACSTVSLRRHKCFAAALTLDPHPSMRSKQSTILPTLLFAVYIHFPPPYVYKCLSNGQQYCTLGPSALVHRAFQGERERGSVDAGIRQTPTISEMTL